MVSTPKPRTSRAISHSTAACVGPAGDRTMLDGAKALALTALAVAADPTLLTRR